MKQIPKGSNVVEKIIHEIQSNKPDFRDRGSYVYKSYWDQNQLVQQDGRDKIICDDPDLILDCHITEALEAASYNAKVRKSLKHVPKKTNSMVNKTAPRAQSRGFIKARNIFSKTPNPAVDHRKNYITADQFRNIVQDGKSRQQVQNHWPSVNNSAYVDQFPQQPYSLQTSLAQKLKLEEKMCQQLRSHISGGISTAASRTKTQQSQGASIVSKLRGMSTTTKDPDRYLKNKTCTPIIDRTFVDYCNTYTVPEKKYTNLFPSGHRETAVMSNKSNKRYKPSVNDFLKQYSASQKSDQFQRSFYTPNSMHSKIEPPYQNINSPYSKKQNSQKSIHIEEQFSEKIAIKVNSSEGCSHRSCSCSRSSSSLSISSILKSSVDSCQHLGAHISEKKKVSDWLSIKNNLKNDQKIAQKLLMNYKLKEWAKKRKSKNENAIQIKANNYNGLGLKQKKEIKKEEVTADYSNLVQLQNRVNQLLEHLFGYWCKKKTSKYLRIQDFYKNMVIFGLAPNTKFIENVIETFEEKVVKPGYFTPKIPEGYKVPNLVELAKQKPYNQYFVYTVRNGKLVISHIALATILDIYGMNKHCYNLQELLKNRLKNVYLRNLTQKLARNSYNIDSIQQQKFIKSANFSLYMYQQQIQELWDYLDPMDHKEIAKNKIYKFLNENKLLQNADQAKFEEMIRQVTITWGPMYLLGNPEDKIESTNNASNFVSPERPKKLPGLEDFEMVNKAIFVKMFQKPLLHLGIRNAITLLDISHEQMEKDTEFMKNYPKDEVTANFEVLKLQREYLYQTFSNIPKKGVEKKPNQNEMISPNYLCPTVKKKEYFNKQTTAKANPQQVRQMLENENIKNVMKQMLKIDQVDAVEKLSEYALKNPNFNKHFVGYECRNRIKELKTQQKIQERERRTLARVKCLAMGYRLEQFDFNHEDTLLKFGQKPIEMFNDMPESEIETDGEFSMEEY